MTEDMKKIIRYAFAAGIALGATGAVLFLTRGCRQENGNTEMGPEEVVERFCRSMLCGDFAAAYGFCDTLAMKSYIENYVQAWEMQSSRDSGAVLMAGAILSGTEITIGNMEKKDGKRIVSYAIETSEGMKKEKTATVRKTEEGEWIVEEIADRI